MRFFCLPASRGAPGFTDHGLPLLPRGGDGTLVWHYKVGIILVISRLVIMKCKDLEGLSDYIPFAPPPPPPPV